MVNELLSTLRALDVKLWVEGEQIRVSTPKGALQPELRQRIKELKPELMALLRASQTNGTLSHAEIPLVSRTQPLVLSSAQQRLWFLDQLTPGSSAYNLFSSQHIRTPLDAVIMQRCLTELVRRHELLRTNFRLEQGQPVQVITPPTPWQLRVLDLQPLAAEEREQKIAQAVAEETSRPFDLSADPLFRTLLIQSAPADYVFVTVMHHIISDAMSISLINREVAALYRSYSLAQPSPLPELAVQYADYAAWQQSLLQSSTLKAQLAYWKNRLGDDLPALELPMDIQRQPAANLPGGWQSWVLSPELSTQLAMLSQSGQVTLFMVMLAAFKLLLHRLSGQEDIVVGTPISGRNHPALEPLVGLFLNTIVLRTDLSGDPTFTDLLRRVQDTTLGAYDNQDLPFERLVEELQPDRSLHHNPLFDLLVNFFSQPDANLEVDAVGYDLRDSSSQDPKLPMTFYIDQYRDRIGLRVLYQQTLFSAARVRCLLEQYEFLLQQITADPFQPISAYSLVTPSASSLLPDPTQLLEEPHHAPIMQLLLRWAQESPDLPALVQDSERWSYGMLGERATVLAKTLLALGCQHGDVVAVTGPRSPGLIAAMVAVLLSGGVLLTLDPVLPPKRRQVMLREANARWIVECGAAPLGAPRPAVEAEHSGLPLLWVDANSGRPAAPMPDTDLAAVTLPAVSPNDPAYVFFTSGTTNVPKGVLGIHKGLSHFLNWQRTTFAIGPGDRSAQFTGLSFDVVLRDIFLPLTSGAALYLPSDAYLVGSGRAIRWLHDNAITVLHTVPGIVQSWLAEPPPGVQLTSLRWAFFAGEPLSDALVHAWRRAFSAGGGVVNLYGPTETTLAKFYYQVPEAMSSGVQPVGAPLPQTQALVLRQGNRLCGIGEPGEIVIRTPFRTLGYINAGDEQRRHFVANPFRTDSQDLVYYTGDRGRYRLDGTLDILGRLDDQIKINGVRIELGEITAALLAHPAVKSAAVIARKDDQQYDLAAYLVKDRAAQLSVEAVREHLADRFPAAMVPRSYVFLDKLPLNPNGKVDRRALPPPPAPAAAGAIQSGVPHDLTEARLIEIWQRLLKVEKVGTHDDFFALGGYSMLAVRMFAQIQETFGVLLPLTSLFKKATIEHLASLIHAQIGDTPWSSLVEMQPTGSKPPFYCVHGMTGDVFWFNDLLPYLDPDQPFWGLQSRGLDGIQPPLTAIEAMAAHYISELRALQPEGPYYIGGYSYGGSVAYEMACQLQRQGQEVALLAVLDHATPASGYYTYQVTPHFLRHFFHNLPYRIHDFFRRRPDQIWARIRRQFVLFNKAADRSIHHTQAQAHAAGANELIDQAPDLPAHVQRIIEINFDAILHYQPQPYAGVLTLLRARGGRLFCTHDPKMGWGQYAKGGVDVKVIPGSHLRLFHKSHIGQLANQLQQCLDEAQLLRRKE